MEIRGTSISYPGHRAKMNKLHENELKTELNALEKTLINDDDNQRYKTVKKEVELINNE